MKYRATAMGMTLALSIATPAAWAAGSHAGGHEQSAIGEPGKAAKVNRTVQIDMSDAMRFSPSSIAAKQGETIRFVVRNSGKVKHELVLGTAKELAEHYEVMKKHPDMEHDDANMVTVAPGKSGEVIWRFSKAGKIDFACLQPGHYDAGMKGLVQVAAAKAHGHGTAPQRDNPTLTAQAGAASDMTAGEVRKVDLDGGKVTLRHAEIKSLDMPAMTMVFVVKDRSMLERLKAGDKVKFKAINDAGKYTVTEIESAK